MRLTGDYQLSSDVLQESFTRLLSRYGAHENSVALLFTIARNIVFDSARQSGRFRNLSENPPESEDNPEKKLLVRETYQKVLGALQQLDPSERDILALVASSELPYREIAAITGLSEPNVRVKIHRARLKLKKLLQQGDNDTCMP